MIALQVSSALTAAEKQGLVHRDLKPANLMLVYERTRTQTGAEPSRPGGGHPHVDIPVVKVIDFGVAKALAEKPDAMGLTHGGFVGTPAFASPEQFTDARVDVRSDIYSLGATLVSAHRPQTFSGAPIDSSRGQHRKLYDQPTEGGTCSKAPYVAARVDACRASGAPECPVSSASCNCKIAALRF